MPDMTYFPVTQIPRGEKALASLKKNRGGEDSKMHLILTDDQPCNGSGELFYELDTLFL